MAGTTAFRRANGDGHEARVLVVGCGFIGRHMASGLAEAGRHVAVLSRRDPPPEVAAVLDPADVHVGDAGDADALHAALEGVRHVVWCAGGLLPPDAERDPVADEDLTLGPLRTLVDVLDARAGVSVTYVSSGGTVYGNPGMALVHEDAPLRPIGAYGRVRLAGERLLLEANLDVRVLRCANVYGEHQPPDRSQGAVAVFLDRVSNGEEIVLYGGGATVRDFVYVGDVVTAVEGLLGRPGPQVVNVGSGRGVSIRELLELVERTVGRRAQIAELPARPFDVNRVVLDVTRLLSLVPFEPLPLGAGLARTAAAPLPASSAALR
ncbi:MAG: NAD-dependent epimerase/dehydratase family protein [Conexibacter sp.]